jgi:hypothetical protein
MRKKIKNKNVLVDSILIPFNLDEKLILEITLP